MDQGEPVSVRIVEQVAAHHGVDPLELEPRLHTVVDPDALDTFVRRSARDAGGALGHVQFTYKGCTVTVDGDGTVDVAPPAGDTASNSTTAAVTE